MSVLYIVPTPIGNLDDMVPRAVSVLQQVDVIAAEDTRHSATLMRHFSISTPMVAYHDHNEGTQTEYLMAKLANGEAIALISDAGTPLVSDPGYRLVSAAVERGYQVVPIPGAVAAMAALSASGLPSDRFAFEGFLPSKSSKRVEALRALRSASHTLIFYESSHRIVDSINDMTAVFGNSRRACIAREITKKFETIKTAQFADLSDWLASDSNQQRGEFVVLVEGADGSVSEAEINAFDLLTKLAKHLPPNKAAALAADITGQSKRVLYQWLLDQKINN